mgnify:CR=1 FL=1
MEKKLYELRIDEEFEHLLPPPQDAELERLTQQLLEEGCRDSLVTWNGVIVDGHNRYRICLENRIPFTFSEMEFDNRDEAKLWIINTQMGRRNLTDFAKCELVLPLEATLKAVAKKTQGRRNDLTNFSPNLAKSKKTDTREDLAQMAGVSHGNLDKAKKLIASANDETLEKLRSGELSIHTAYTQMKDRKEEKQSLKTNPDEPGLPEPRHSSLIPSEDSMEPAIKGYFPGNGLVKSVQPTPYVRPSDDVYEIPPIEAYGNMPSDNMELRGNAEFIHASSDLTKSTELYVRRAGDILRGMSGASINDENIKKLKAIVTNGYEQIINLLNSKNNGGNYNDHEDE